MSPGGREPGRGGGRPGVAPGRPHSTLGLATRVRLLGLAVAIAAAGAAALGYGARRWRAATDALHAGLAAARRAPEPATYRASELRGLPAPVQRYFRAVLTDGQPVVAAVRLEHTGRFNLSATGARWKPFRSTQRVVTRRPGFAWEARVALAPGLAVRVHDAYVAGEGILQASLFGLVAVAALRGTPAAAQGELLRFLAEAAWYPTALLPSQGVAWEAVDAASARATLRDGGTTATLLVRFAPDGLIAAVRAEARGRLVAGAVVPTPWEGRWRRYERHGGMRVPLEGDVAWLLPEGPKCYWCGRVTRIEYEVAS